MPENSGHWSQARSPSRGQTLLWQGGIKNVSLKGPEDFYGIGNAKGLLPGTGRVFRRECEKDLRVVGKMFRYLLYSGIVYPL
jgi:hypothetical protein